ncbi:fungal specific transcription factor [Colletotrichum salicis]|uniref:lytic cellulose monooxygenase (C4-dehydrogenating) n=1 Tax=Colletotrichum salicis TaxID=1209931 RepID=A0A135V061_9PEZI|nr:fungal specific transcription factor [Colletotrichum salicis]
MKWNISAAIVAVAGRQIAAHATFQQLWVDGTDMIRLYLYDSNSPVTNVAGNEIRCNVGGTSGVNAKCPVKAGGTVTIEMHQSGSGSGDDDNWGTKDLNTCCGKMDVPISKDIADGDYLLRAEVIALHAAGPSGGAQLYMTCFQLSVLGGTGTAKPATVSFPGAYKASDPGIAVNIHAKLSGYTVPGPAVASIGTTKTAGSGCSGCASTCDASKGPVGTTLPVSPVGGGGTSPGTGSPPSCTVQKYAQCGGQGWTGCTTCACTFVEAAAPRKRLLTADDGPNTGDGSSLSHVGSRMVASATTMPSPSQLFSQSPDKELEQLNYTGDLNFSTTQSEFEAMFRSPQAPSTPSAVWMSTPRQSNSKEEAEYPPGANPQLLGLSGDMDPLLLRHYRFDDHGMFGFKELAIHSVQDQPVPCHFLVSQQSIFSRRRQEAGSYHPEGIVNRQELEDIIPVAVGQRLIKLFWDFIQPRWPILSIAQPVEPSSSSPHLLAAIYSITLPFALHDDKLSVDVAYDKPPYPALAQIINKALIFEVHSPSIVVAQTLLLLALRPSADPLVADTVYRRDIVGRLVACATTLGLHLDPSGWSMPDWQKAQRQRLSFCIFAVDTWTACVQGSPTLIHRDNWLITAVEHESYVGSGMRDQDETQLLQFSAVTEILNSALTSLFSTRAINDLAKSDDKTCVLTKPLLQSLSSVVILTDSTTNSQRLAHLYIRMIILRAGLRPVLVQGSTGYDASDERASPMEEQREAMRGCTRGLSDVVKSLSSDTDNWFWPSWTQLIISSICFTQMTMAISSHTYQEAFDWITDLQSTRKSLRLKVASFSFLRLGLLRIDALFWRGLANVFHLEEHIEAAFKAADSA